MNNIEDLTKILLDEKTTKEMAKDIKMSKENWDDFQSIINDYLSTLDGEENQLNIQISLSAIVD
ncbi:hypothetical protein CW697_06020 [Macrococcoides caseolyticum]|uniref:hypothetical protein n=1 Tax=Macrococcoides caseolyticum TaxID=69966 RepID=UPI000C338738|nr:hypothetical protein [Macrococcus caseolyticus]PKE30595.1 hypothetical protein CW668_10980 [Macrococcus caseolyticus]PKF29792.1 hypothetical protein CW697_06020 [Macrococcus caseolyticus]TDM15202.1 hypothetical protein ETI00_08495 [Macrococcus caseolyticus]VUC66080.1 Uncharacterised protein [Macrococcus caseolyticus]